MAYVQPTQAQQWLQDSKYAVLDVALEHESYVKNMAFALLERRYDTSQWLDDASTPEMVLDIMTMMVASLILRRAVGEDDGQTAYCDWLWGRGEALFMAIAEGKLDIPGVTEDPDSAEGGVPVFWPTDDATDLWFDDPLAEGAAARAFDMEKVF